MEKIVIEKAAIVGVKHKIQNGTVSSQIEFVAHFDSSVAKQMGVRWTFFNSESMPKDGIKEVLMDYEMKNLRLSLQVPKLEKYNLDLTSESASKFKVIKTGGKKKGVSTMRLKFVVEHAGSPYELLDYLLNIGGADGHLEIELLQKELFSEEKAKEGKRRPRHTANGPTSRPVTANAHGD